MGIKDYSNIVILGGAGLVGQNLVLRLLEEGADSICVVDKHENNCRILRELHPKVKVVVSDVNNAESWQEELSPSSALVMLHAQIGGKSQDLFEKNNVSSTRVALDVVRQRGVRRLIHVSSSVVESVANDWYTDSKTRQEEMVAEFQVSSLILRPTLMFGWFDRKHLGWLARFMKKSPIFPIPGNGRFMRQPLYAGDFSNIIVAGLDDPDLTGVFNITGQQRVDYVDIIRAIKTTTRARAWLIHIPPNVFSWLLKIWALFDSDPPFTASQLEALMAHDEFEVIDWPSIFGVSPTEFEHAIDLTFNHPRWSHVVLEF